jgi:hypothetical protein
MHFWISQDSAIQTLVNVLISTLAASVHCEIVMRLTILSAQALDSLYRLCDNLSNLEGVLMRSLCQFGVELPYNVADPFLTKPERFFSVRLMPEGSSIPHSPHGQREMAARLKEMGAEFAGYDLHYDDLDAVANVAEWASQNDLALYLNNPVCQVNASPTDGFHTWVYPCDLLKETKSKVKLLGVIYDELIHHQLHPGLTGHTNPWTALADVRGAVNTLDAYEKIECGLKKLFDSTEPSQIPAYTEQVFPVLFHAVARAGGFPGCKVLKEQITPITVSLCMSAAHQYGKNWFATVDLWEGDSGPWYQIMGRHSGHSPKEYLNALKLMALLNPVAAMTETADVLWEIDSPDAKLTEFGEIHKTFMKNVRPQIAPSFDARSWRPTVAIVHSDDGCYQRPDPLQFDEPKPIYANADYYLLGAPHLATTEAASKWLRAWYHLSWGRCSGKSLHNYFNPLEVPIARQNEVGGNEHDFTTCPPLSMRRDPSRLQTHMHTLFTPLNNVAVFDGYVSPQQLQSAELIVLCGSYCRSQTQEAVLEAVKRGARCLCQKECAPSEFQNASGRRLGNGYWWTVEDFDTQEAIEQFLRFRGYHNQWVLRSDLGTLRVYSTDAWGNEIGWELESGVGR